ncbi:esterase/lipase family protein [Dyella humicola]|uniref:esterase/lipase family protein n=1 Tax=Dyella humicola TaxID=2992126 RepID=UPI00224CB14D|nr:alpha/beta fold hydrolase [Dyella humicola]
MRRLDAGDNRTIAARFKTTSCLAAQVRRGPAASWRLLGLWTLCLLLAACASVPHQGTPSTAPPDPLVEARRLWRELPHQSDPETSARIAMHCAAYAYLALGSRHAGQRREAEAISNTCSGLLVDFLLEHEPPRWTSETLSVGESKLAVEFRGVSSSLSGTMALIRADTVLIPPVMGTRYATPGLGIPLVAIQARCTDHPACRLFPSEGVARPVTAWVEQDGEGMPQLVMTDPTLHPDIVVADQHVVLASDVTAPLAALYDRSRLDRLAIWNLLGGTELAVREGLYLLEDYDPNKTPIIMLHGLGRSPLIWARLTNMIFGSPELHARYQVWHVVFPTNTPILLDRHRVQQFLDDGWRALDPSGTAPARQNMVLIGHSLGGVMSRLLASNSDEVIWNAVFDEPVTALSGTPADIAVVDSIFHFKAYPGVSRAIFLAAPHKGSPVADEFIGQLALRLVRVSAPEVDALLRVAKANRQHESVALAADYQKEGLSSISTLRPEQPVSHAAQSLMPVASVRYYTFAGSLPGARPPGDGFVPLSSAILPGATSTTIVKSGHQLYLKDEVLTKILEILRQP